MTNEQIYDAARKEYGDRNQCIVAIEELSELQKELTKYLRGEGNREHIAEEIADALIMIEQIIEIFGISECVQKYKNNKIYRLLLRIMTGK